MPHLSRFIVVACLTALVATSPLFAQEMEDVVFLKDGSIVRGTVIERIPGESLKIQTQAGTVFVYTMDEITRMTKEPVMGLGGRMGARQKQPLRAFGLSLLIPGAGQFYNGQHGKGVAQLGAVVLGWGLMISAVEDNSLLCVDVDCLYDDPDPDDDDGRLGVGLLLWLGGHLWSIIDAPISANRINQQSQQSNYGHLMEFDVDRVALGVDPVVQPDRVGTRLTFHF